MGAATERRQEVGSSLELGLEEDLGRLLGWGRLLPDLVHELLPGHLGVSARKSSVFLSRARLSDVQHFHARLLGVVADLHQGYRGALGNNERKGGSRDGSRGLHDGVALFLRLVASVGPVDVAHSARVLLGIYQ